MKSSINLTAIQEKISANSKLSESITRPIWDIYSSSAMVKVLGLVDEYPIAISVYIQMGENI